MCGWLLGTLQPLSAPFQKELGVYYAMGRSYEGSVTKYKKVLEKERV